MGGDQKSKETLKNLYQYIMKFFLDSGINFILFYGSLLGYTRESDFINKDDDIDVLVSRNQRELFMNIVKEKEIKTWLFHDDLIQLCFSDIGPFDVYFYDDHGDDILLKWDSNLLFRKINIFPLKKIIFHDYEIYTPYDPETILTELYADWKIPKIKGVDYTIFSGKVRRL